MGSDADAAQRRGARRRHQDARRLDPEDGLKAAPAPRKETGLRPRFLFQSFRPTVWAMFDPHQVRDAERKQESSHERDRLLLPATWSSTRSSSASTTSTARAIPRTRPPTGSRSATARPSCGARSRRGRMRRGLIALHAPAVLRRVVAITARATRSSRATTASRRKRGLPGAAARDARAAARRAAQRVAAPLGRRHADLPRARGDDASSSRSIGTSRRSADFECSIEVDPRRAARDARLPRRARLQPHLDRGAGLRSRCSARCTASRARK